MVIHIHQAVSETTNNSHNNHNNHNNNEVADFGRRRVGPAVIDARRNLSGVCGLWYPVFLDLHRFFIAISRIVVNYDGNDGTAPDPVVWSAGALPKRRRLVHAVRDLAMLPGPPAVWTGDSASGPVAVGLLVVRILGLVVSLMLSCSSFVSFGLARG